MGVLDKGLANPVTVAEMTTAYNSAIRKVTEAYQLLDDAQQELTTVFGNEYGRFDTLPDRHDYYNHNSVTDGIKERLKRCAWRAVINRLDIKKILSIKRAEKLDEQMEKGDLPEISDASILDMMENLTGSAQELAREAALEVFEFLRPAAKNPEYRAAQYATNQKNGRYDLGKKVILTWMVENSFGGRGGKMHVRYGDENKLRALDRVFYLLDGKGVPEGYQSPLIDAINTSPDGEGETTYFKFRACQNMNLHIEFKRLDLVTKLNQIAGNPSQLKDKPYQRATSQPAMI